MSVSREPVTLGVVRWRMLAIICLGFFALKLNWFDAAAAFRDIAIFRVVSGLRGSVFIAVAFGAVMVWFKDRDVTVALGLSGGASFSGDAAVALFIWVYLQNATSWHLALCIAGAIELMIAAVTALMFEVPAGTTRLRGVSFEREGLLSALRRRDLWIHGVALLGAYGAFFTVSQLFTTYAVTTRGLPAHEASLLAAVVTLAGIPGSVLGGLIADRITNLKALFVGSIFAAAILLALIPQVGTTALWFVGGGIGFCVTFGFAAWASVPERVVGIKHENLGTATGLMLTIAAVGGYFVPRIFGQIVPAHGYTYGWTAKGSLPSGATRAGSSFSKDSTRGCGTSTSILTPSSSCSSARSYSAP